MESAPSTAIPFATCTGNQEACRVELLSADRMTTNNLSSVKCTRSGVNTARAYSTRYKDAQKTSVQTINVLQDTLVATTSGSRAPALVLDNAVVGDLKTFQYNGTCALKSSNIRVVSEDASGVRNNCEPFQPKHDSVQTDGCSYFCSGTSNTNVTVSDACGVHLRSLSPGVVLVLRGECNVSGSQECSCAIETPPYTSTAVDVDGELPQPHSYYAVS